MPSRTIRDSILDSERYHACGVESRLLFLELLLCSDDYALVPIGDVYLRRHTTVCEGKTIGQIAGFLAPLVDQDLIRPYSSSRGGRFAFIPRFDNIPQAVKPKWPVPPTGLDGGYIDSMIPKAKRNRIKQLHENDQVRTGSRPRETETETETEKIKDTHCATEPAVLVACPQQEIIALWKKMLPGLRPPRSWGLDRQRHLAARWRELLADEEFEDRESGLTWFAWFFDFIGKSPFLTGKVPGVSGKPPFTASLDWVLLPTNFAKIIDRNYHPQGMNV